MDTVYWTYKQVGGVWQIIVAAQAEWDAMDAFLCQIHTASIFDIIYYAGLAACGIQGAKLAKQFRIPFVFALLMSSICAYGGGFIRDTLLLQTYPVVFTHSSMLGIFVAIIVGSLYLFASEKSQSTKLMQTFSFVGDALGLGTFIAYGIDNAVAVNAPSVTTILSGVITALGGGITCSLICGVPVCKVLLMAPMYRLITLLGSLLYWICLSNYGVWVARGIIIIYTGITVLLQNQQVRHQFILLVYRLLGIASSTLPHTAFICLTIFIQGSQPNTFPNRALQIAQYQIIFCVMIKILTLLFHHLRLMLP